MSGQLSVTPGEPTSYMGPVVQDDHGEAIGSVSDVVHDDATQQPQWLVVQPGKLLAEHFVPAEGAYTTEEGNLVVAFTRRIVTEAPKASGDHLVTHDIDNDRAFEAAGRLLRHGEASDDGDRGPRHRFVEDRQQDPAVDVLWRSGEPRVE